MFPKRNYNQTVAVNSITDIRELSCVAKRFSITAEYLRKAVHTNKVVLAYPTLVGLRQTEMTTVAAAEFCLGVAAVADFVVERDAMPRVWRDVKQAAWVRFHPAVLDIDRIGEVVADFAALRKMRDDCARRLLAEHNAEITTLVRQSAQGLKAAMVRS